jgi:hypothetical protein
MTIGNHRFSIEGTAGDELTPEQFWTEFLTILEQGNLTSDPSYYFEGRAQAADFANVISKIFERTAAGSEERQAAVNLLDEAGFWTSTDNRQFWVDAEFEELGEDLQNLKNAGELRLPNLTFDGTPFDLPGGGGDSLQGVMEGGDVIRVVREDGTDYYALRYVVEGIEHLYSFDSKGAAEQAVGSVEGVDTLAEDDVDDGDTWLLGDAAGFVGVEGSYGVYFDDVMTEAGLEAGIRNPGKVGEYLSQPEIQRIIAMGEAGDWSQERIQAELRLTNYYQNELYPGIKAFLDEGIGNPEAAWRNYHNSVEASLDALGYTRDSDGSYRTVIGEMLGKGIRDDEFTTNAQVFIRAEQSPEFADVLNQWVQNDTGSDLTFDQWFDVLAGTSDAELDAIVEKATLQFQAEQTSLLLDPSQISRIASLTQFSEAQIAAGFSQAEQQLLALGQQGLTRYGLSEEALVNAGFGLETEGFGSAAEVGRLATKTIRELGIADDPKAQFFQGFSQEGKPVRTGLLAGAPEAG